MDKAQKRGYSAQGGDGVADVPRAGKGRKLALFQEEGARVGIRPTLPRERGKVAAKLGRLAEKSPVVELPTVPGACVGLWPPQLVSLAPGLQRTPRASLPALPSESTGQKGLSGGERRPLAPSGLPDGATSAQEMWAQPKRRARYPNSGGSPRRPRSACPVSGALCPRRPPARARAPAQAGRSPAAGAARGRAPACARAAQLCGVTAPREPPAGQVPPAPRPGVPAPQFLSPCAQATTTCITTKHSRRLPAQLLSVLGICVKDLNILPHSPFPSKF